MSFLDSIKDSNENTTTLPGGGFLSKVSFEPAKTNNPINVSPLKTTISESTPTVATKAPFLSRVTSGIKDFFFKQEPITQQAAFNKPSEAITTKGTKSMELAYNLLNRTPEFFAGLSSKVLAVAFPGHEIPTPFGIDAGRLTGAGGKEGEKKLQTYGQDYLDNWAKADATTGLTGDQVANPSNPRSLFHGTISAMENVILPSLAVSDLGVGVKAVTKEFLEKTGFQETLGLKYSELSDLRPADFTKTVTNRTKEVFDNLVTDVQAKKVTPEEANIKLGKIRDEYQDLGNLYQNHARDSGTYTLGPVGKAYEDIAVALNENIKDLGSRNYAPIEGATRPADETLPGYKKGEGQASAFGLSTEKVEPVGFGDKPPVYQGETDLSTKVLEDLKGKSTVSKQYILDATNRGELKQSERDIIRSVLNDYPDTVPVADFAKKVKAELLPLKRGHTPGDTGTRYEHVSLPDELKGDVKTYSEQIYQSPIKTSAGDVHYSQARADGYFGHTRVEDMSDQSTRRVIEVQSDLYQKGNLESERATGVLNIKYIKNGKVYNLESVGKGRIARISDPEELSSGGFIYKNHRDVPVSDIPKSILTEYNTRQNDVNKLQQYNDPTAHFRMVREEIKHAVESGKTKLQFPTGTTAMKIEGLGDIAVWRESEHYGKLTPENIKVGMEIHKDLGGRTDGETWVVTEVLADGKFKAINKSILPTRFEYMPSNGKTRYEGPGGTRELHDGKYTREDWIKEHPTATESFDLSPDDQTSNPIYKFYEKDLGRYLTNKFSAKIVTDSKGVTWYEVPLSKEMGSKPVEAFKLSPEGRTRLREGVSWTPEQATEVVRTFFSPKETEFIPTIKPITQGQSFGARDKKIEGVAFRGYDEKTLQFRDFIKVLVENGKVNDGLVLHEVFEKAVQLAFDDKEFGNVLKNVQGNPLSVFLRDNYSRDIYSTKDLRAKETLADDFAEYVRDKSGYKGQNATLWEKLLQYIRGLWRKWTGAEKLYDDLISGKRMKNVEDLKDIGNEYGLSAEEPPRKVGEVKIGDQTVDVTKGGTMDLPIERPNARPSISAPTPDEGTIRMRTKNLESANKQYLKTSKKEAEVDLPKKEVLEIRRKELQVKTVYNTSADKANDALSQIINEMDLSQKGSRTMSGSGPDTRFIATPSTFPKWVPDDLRSKKLFDSIVAKVGSLQDLHYPDRTVSLREARLVDEIFNRIDDQTGLNTKDIRAGIPGAYTQAGRLEAKDTEATNKILEKTYRETAKTVNTEEREKQHIERAKKAEEESAKLMAEEKLYNSTLQQKINQAHAEAKQKLSTWGKIKAILKPTEVLDPKTQELTKSWLDRKDAIKEIANEEYRKSVPLGPQNFNEIIDFQAGKQTPYIKEAFDSIGTEFKRRGLDFNFLDDYVPQVWREADGKFLDISAKYLKEKGLTDEEIKAYLAGRTMAPTQALRLKLRPSFVKERFFPNYEAGMARGLKPKYKTPAQLMAYYREQGEISLNNKNYIESLKSEAKLLPVDDAPTTWEPVSLRFAREGLYARPELARLINGVFRDGDNLTLIPWAVQKFSRLARFMFDMRTMAGVPNTTINSFAIGQANRLIVSALGNLATLDISKLGSDLRASFAFIRANSNAVSAKWFEKNKEYILKMADQGIAPGQYPGSYETVNRSVADVLTSVSNDANFLGKGLNVVKNAGAGAKYFFLKWINDKTMKSMMAQINLQTFKDTYIEAMASGLTEEESSRLAGDVTKKFNGLIGNVGRAPGTTEALQAGFTAPYFRESVIATLYNGFKGGSYEFTNPVYTKSKKFLLGMIITYGLYNILNKELNDNYMWQNPPGHEFQLRIPKKDGGTIYITFMPSFLAIARNLGSAAINLGTGHFDVATQKAGSLLSTPIELMTEIWSNKDYFGRAIYKITDTGKEKLKKIAVYTGLSVNHPFISETYKFVAGSQSLYQAMTRMMELPVTFGSMTKEQTAEYYDMLDQKTKERAEATKKMMPLYDKLQKMKAEGNSDDANKIYYDLSKEDREVYDRIKANEKRKHTIARKPAIQAIYDSNQELKASGRTEEAQNVYLNLSEEDRRIYDNIKEALN